jgi:regulator of protease activity HflC (stomatin/prohibitin superfamily)
LLICSCAERKRWAWPADVKRFICRSRRRVGWCEFSARLLRPLCLRCSTEGITSAFAALSLASLSVFVWKGLYVLQPNYSAVLQLFGSYIGPDATTGLRWVNPFYTVTKVSRRVQTMESAKIKVNDLNGSPIEIAAAVIWRVRDSAKAVLQVENYGAFVQIQSETSVRKLASV